MAKVPVKGEVKTRLIPWLGEEGALTFYSCLLKDRLDELSRLERVDIYIACYPFEDRKVIDDLIPESLKEKVKFIPQEGSDLGQRILSVLKSFDLTREALVLIDTDTPALTSSLITRALENLENCDLVIGPSTDGGYYLIGLKNFYPELFIDIPWGTEKVFSATVDRAKKRNLLIKFLPELIDIDTEKDAILFYSSASHRSLTRTVRFLGKIFEMQDSREV